MKVNGFLSFLLFVSTIHFSFGQNYVFAQLTGTPMNTTGWNMQGDAHVGNIVGTADSEMVICSLSAMIQPSYLNMNPGSSGACFITSLSIFPFAINGSQNSISVCMTGPEQMALRFVF